MLYITSVMLSKRITLEVSTRGLIKKISVILRERYFADSFQRLLQYEEDNLMTSKIIFTCEKESSSLQQYSPQSRSYS